jgi:sphinganine-1-phosphate aldolase
VDAAAALSALPPLGDGLIGVGPLDSDTAAALLRAVGIAGDAPGLPDEQAPLLALIEALPRPVTERLLVELLARIVEPG